jgi:hypothetical protein
MTTLINCLADCEKCRESARLRRVRQERQQVKRDERRARRDAARQAVSNRIAGTRHLAHPGSAARCSLRQWRQRIIIWSVQGLILAAALLFLTYIASHVLHLG